MARKYKQLEVKLEDLRAFLTSSFGRSGSVTHDWCAFVLDGDFSVTQQEQQ